MFNVIYANVEQTYLQLYHSIRGGRRKSAQASKGCRPNENMRAIGNRPYVNPQAEIDAGVERLPPSRLYVYGFWP